MVESEDPRQPGTAAREATWKGNWIQGKKLLNSSKYRPPGEHSVPHSVGGLAELHLDKFLLLSLAPFPQV